MKVKVGHVESWHLELDARGLPGEPVEIELPEDQIDKIKIAEKLWNEALEILQEVYDKQRII